MKLIFSSILLIFQGAQSGKWACTQDVFQCPDGTYVGRTGRNCEFNCAVSSVGSAAGDAVIKICPLDPPQSMDTCNFKGTCYYGKETCCGQSFDSYGCDCIDGQSACFYTDACLGAPAKCKTTTKEPLMCATDVKQCSDGSYVSRDSNNNCEFKPCPMKPPCGGFENCETYNDGCNDCQCGLMGDACTKMGCPPIKPAAKCIRCKPGYQLNDSGRCILTPSCGGIAYCQSYRKDICNTCGCPDPINEPEISYCTLMACADLEQPVCTNCIDGYVLNDITKQCEKDIENEICCDPLGRPSFLNGGCFEGSACCPNGEWTCSIGDGRTFPCGDKQLVIDEDTFGDICEVEGEKKIECKMRKNCDEGYECKPDPVCLGNNRIPSLSCKGNKVCLSVSGQCMFDGNCESDHKCVMINDKNGFCTKYQK